MAITEEGLARIAAAGLRPEQLPRHIAIIMDGNGRWAQRQGLPRIMGHRRGIQSVRAVVEEGCRLGLCASLRSFASLRETLRQVMAGNPPNFRSRAA